MKQPKTFDLAIIGGGIVGCATARALAQSTGASMVVLEAEEKLDIKAMVNRCVERLTVVGL